MMANPKNLVKGGKAHKLTAEDASKGGKKSVETRRKKRTMQETMQIIMQMGVKSGDIPNVEEIQSVADMNKLNMTVETAILISQAMKAVKESDTRAAEFVRDTSGNKPIEKIMVAEVDQNVIDECEKAVLDDIEND